MRNFAGTNHKARRLVLDYALGAAIIALLPIPRIRVLKAIVLLLLHYRLIRDIGQLWRWRRGGGFLARLGLVTGLGGAVALGLLGWLWTIALGALFPNLDVLAPGTALFCYFWSIGQTVNHYYLSGIGRPGEQVLESHSAIASTTKAPQDET